MTKTNDIQKKTDTELISLIAERKEALRQQRFAVAGSKGRDVKKMRTDRKDVARALTALSMRRKQNAA